MKKYKMLFLTVLLFLCLPLSVKAENYSVDGADTVKSALPDEVNDILDSYGITPDSTEWTTKEFGKSVFSHIGDFLKKGAKAPIKAGGTSLAIIIIAAAVNALSSKSDITKTAALICGLALVLFLITNVYGTVSASAKSIKGCATFMLSFVPMYAGIIAVSGGAVTSVTMSSLLLAAAEAVSMLAAYIIVPLMGGYLALSVCTAASPLLSGSSVCESVKKAAIWIFSFITTVFLGILSMQTAVNSAADSVALRTSKFIVGTAVPVAGPALSEAVGTVTSSMQLLKSTAGIYGVAALALMLLPILIELLLWRICMMLLNMISEILEAGKVTSVFKAVDTMLGMLVGIIMLVGVLFIISLTVVISTGKSL